MNKVYVYGSINYDLVMNSPRIPQKGETLSGDGFFTNSGGKGANQATASAKLGADTYLIGAVGKDSFGTECITTLERFNVKTDFVRKLDTNTGIAMIIVTDGDNRIILNQGANYKFDDEELSLIITNNVSKNDIFVTQLETPISQVKEALKLAKSKGAYTILNPAPAQALTKDLLSNVDLLIPNETELELISGVKIDYNDFASSIKNAIDVLTEKGVNDIIVTLGEKGCYYKGEIYPAFKTNVVDTTGAGDTFIGALAFKLSLGEKISESIRFCQYASSKTITRKGAQISMPSFDEVSSIQD